MNKLFNWVFQFSPYYWHYWVKWHRTRPNGIQLDTRNRVGFVDAMYRREVSK